MKKIKWMRIVLIVMSAFLLISAALVGWISRKYGEENVIEVSIREDTVQTVEFENLCLLPGEQCSYTLSMSSEKAEKYDLKLQFVETEEKTLKHFAYVRIESDGQILCDQLLAEAFESDAMVLPMDFSQNRNTELTVTYYMPSEVGNEAENAEAIFDLRIVASNE